MHNESGEMKYRGEVVQFRFSQSNLRIASRAGALFAAIACLGLQGQTANAPIPNFAPDDHTSWYPDRPDGDNFLPPESGPGRFCR